MGKKPPKWLAGERVNETILTQRKSVEQLRADRMLRKDTMKDQRSRMKAKLDAKRKKKLSTKKFVPAQAILNKAEKSVKQARGYWKRGEKFTTRLSRKDDETLSKQYQNAPVALVVRTGGKQLPREVKASLAKLGLGKMYQARLIHLNAANDRLCKMLKSFVTIGFPTVSQTETLVRTRGSFWNTETKSKSYISGNLQVEQTLGEFNILSIEELVDAVVNKSDVIDGVLRKLAPFDFHPPRALHLEKHRSARDKLEIENPHAFSAYLESQLEDTARERKKEKSSKSAAVAKRAAKTSKPKEVAEAAVTKKVAKKATTAASTPASDAVAKVAKTASKTSTGAKATSVKPTVAKKAAPKKAAATKK